MQTRNERSTAPFWNYVFDPITHVGLHTRATTQSTACGGRQRVVEHLGVQAQFCDVIRFEGATTSEFTDNYTDGCWRPFRKQNDIAACSIMEPNQRSQNPRIDFVSESFVSAELARRTKHTRPGPPFCFLAATR